MIENSVGVEEGLTRKGEFGGLRSDLYLGWAARG